MDDAFNRALADSHAARTAAEDEVTRLNAYIDQIPYGNEWEALEAALRGVDDDALFAALHTYRRCSEEQARGIVAAYLTALRVERDLPLRHPNG